jgi:hypothetical protein
MALVVPFVDNMKRRFLPSGVRKIKWDDPTFARLIQLFGFGVGGISQLNWNTRTS